MPFSGHLSDRFGRKRIYLIGAVASAVFGFVYFALLNTMVPGLIFLANRGFVRPARYDVWHRQP